MAKTAPESADPDAMAKPGGRVVLVTGMSGAGRTAALKSLEDIGYEAVDNLPLSMLRSFVEAESGTEHPRPLAIGVDIRTRDFGVDPFIGELDRLTETSGREVLTLFLDCDDDTLVRRFTETRRRHPLADDRPVADGLRLERRMLARLRERAHTVIDTSLISPGALKDELSRRFPLDRAPGMSIAVVSFSYRHGLPREADLVFDARFLANPHYNPALRALTGQDAAVAEAISADPDFASFFGGIESMLAVLLPRYEAEGKSYLTIAIGCTGGRHRSVFVAERLAEWLAAQGRRTHLNHRDIRREAGQDMR